jgi:hypothetical protein
MPLEEWDRIQAAGAWKRLPPYQTNRRPTPKPGTDFVARALARGPDRVRRRIEPVDVAAIPPEKLAAPTLGAWRREHGVTDEWCDEAKVAFAVAIVEEAQRYILLERLDSIMQFLAVGATPDQAMARVRQLVAEYDDRPSTKAAA